MLVLFIADGSGKSLAISSSCWPISVTCFETSGSRGFLAVTLGWVRQWCFRQPRVGAVSPPNAVDAVFARKQGGAFHAAGGYVG